MPRKIYTAEDHRLAFETWYESQNWSTTAKAVNANYLTPRRWAEADYDCPHNCPYHNWSRLMEERDAALNARHALIQQGNLNPIDHEKAMRAAVSDPGPKAENPLPLKLVRSDLERLGHWELLYAKVFYDLTGVPLDYGQIKGEDAMEKYRMGLHVTNAEAGVRMLKVIQDQIDSLQGSDRKIVAPKNVKKEQVTLQQLRKMRELAKNTPPEKLKTMLTVMDAEDAKPASAAS